MNIAFRIQGLDSFDAYRAVFHAEEHVIPLFLWCWLTGLFINLEIYVTYYNIYLLHLKSNVFVWDILCSKLNYGEIFFTLIFQDSILLLCSKFKREQTKTSAASVWVSRNWFLFQTPKEKVFIKNNFSDGEWIKQWDIYL